MVHLCSGEVQVGATGRAGGDPEGGKPEEQGGVPEAVDWCRGQERDGELEEQRGRAKAREVNGVAPVRVCVCAAKRHNTKHERVDRHAEIQHARRNLPHARFCDNCPPERDSLYNREQCKCRREH